MSSAGKGRSNACRVSGGAGVSPSQAFWCSGVARIDLKAWARESKAFTMRK
jgi:hypothetical protein